MKTVNLIFGLHNHQPVGNFESVFAEAYDLSYKPFLDVLERHPKMKVVVHNTGILFDWLVKNRPEYPKRLADFVAKGQMEIMTGGFYEPIMSVIPDADKVGQILKLTDFIKEHTGYEASGLWMAERVWEPGLAAPLARAGVKYTVLDDSHFRSTGIPERDTYGYFVTEDVGETVAAFPISEKLRYTIPFMEPEATIDYLRSIATEDGETTVVMADDGEKFGVWPDTYQHCYENGWVERFFQALDDNSDWINVTTFSEVMAKIKPRGRVYLPTASYFEMMEWAMPPSAIKRYEGFKHELEGRGEYDDNKVFVRGGFWRNFFTKYPESNQIHKRMIAVSKRLDALRDKATPEQLAKAQDKLWASQCNCGYWHGVFGGLYLPHLRNGLYKNAIEADAILDEVEFGGGPFIRVLEADFDADLNDEVIAETPTQTLIWKPIQGGQLIEHDWKPRGLNVTDTLTRRHEASHNKVAQAELPENASTTNEDGSKKSIHDIVLAKEEGLADLLNYDWYRRSSFVDHFLGEDADLPSWRAASYKEDGDFVNQPYDAEAPTVSSNGTGLGPKTITLTRSGKVFQSSGVKEVTVQKKFLIDPASDEMTVQYMVRNDSASELHARFGIELIANFLAGAEPDRYYIGVDYNKEDNKLQAAGIQEAVSEFGIVDEWMDVRWQVSLDTPADVWRAPIETVSLSEAGFERVFQGSAMMPVWSLSLSAGEAFEASLKVALSPAKDN